MSFEVISNIDHSCKLRCSEGSCKSFLCTCSTESRKFYEWFFSNSLVLKHLKVCATGTKVLSDLTNLDFQVQHLELDCHCRMPSAAILSTRELQALTLVRVSLPNLMCFAVQRKMNLHSLSCRSVSELDKWNLSKFFHLVFCIPELETFEFKSSCDSKLLVDTLFTAWRHCGGRKLKELTVCSSDRACISSLEKLDAIAVVVTLES